MFKSVQTFVYPHYLLNVHFFLVKTLKIPSSNFKKTPYTMVIYSHCALEHHSLCNRLLELLSPLSEVQFAYIFSHSVGSLFT